jgi:hypothetical protein
MIYATMDANRAEELLTQEQRRLLRGAHVMTSGADAVAKGLPRESGGHVLYNRLTPCFLLIAGPSGQARG